MSNTNASRGGRAAVIALLLWLPALAAPGAATAEEGEGHWQTTLGGSISITNVDGGFFGTAVAPNGNGFFADFRVSLVRPLGAAEPSYIAPEDAEARGDSLLDTYRDWRLMDVGYARRLSFSGGRKTALLFLGCGWAHRSGEKRFFHPTGNPGEGVDYWTVDPRLDTDRFNTVGGLIIPIGHLQDYRVSLEIGANRQPGAALIGVGVWR